MLSSDVERMNLINREKQLLELQKDVPEDDTVKLQKIVNELNEVNL